MQLSLFATNSEKERTCTYKGETYRVRDDGSIYRLRRPKKSKRRLDEIWLFGRPTFAGYLHVSGVIVHRIVATAFHGDPWDSSFVVDHIDTNKQNNRPENLRWLSRLDNLVLNPITASRITQICGSVEAFLEDPASFKERFRNPDFSWMGKVTKEEAEQTLAKFLEQAKIVRGTIHISPDSRIRSALPEISNEMEITASCSPHCLQRNWKTCTAFPMCPAELAEEPLIDYLNNLSEGKVFCEHEFNICLIIEVRFDHIAEIIYVLSRYKELSTKEFTLAKVTFEDRSFIHEGLGTYFQLEGAKKALCLTLGEEWTGGDTIDDFC